MQQRINCSMPAAMLAFSLSMPLAAAANERGIAVDQRWSGWSNATEEADSDGVPGGGDRAFIVAQGSGGRVEAGSQSDIAPWDGVSFCKFVDGFPLGIEVYYVTLSTIWRYPNGDLRYDKLSSSPVSSACVDYTDGTFTGVIYVDVVGGTGRFRGATGSLTSKFSGGPALQPGHTGFEGTTQGTIYPSR